MISKNLKFLGVALVSTFFAGWGINALSQNLENFFYWHEFSSNPKILAAEASQLEFIDTIRNLKPIRNNDTADLETDAKAAISILLDRRGNQKILFAKNIDESLPIASVSKLMTAEIISENYDLARIITVSKEAINQEENFGKLAVGAELTVQELLYPLIMESSNDAAFALANDYDGMTEKTFVGLMNEKAKALDLNNTSFVNTNGLDPTDTEPKTHINKSSARDLTVIAGELLQNQLILEIMTTPEINLYNQTLTNTNKLLGVIPGIIGGKTGYTDTALGCFVLITDAPKDKGILISVVLGSNDRFGEMEKLINWTRESYQW